MSDAAEILSDPLLTESAIIERSTAGAWDDDGIWQSSGSTTQIDFIGSIQPMSPDELVILPEGIRERESLRVLTVTELFTENEKDKIPADVIIYQNERYQVQKVDRFSMGLLDHTDAIMTRESL